MKKIFNFTKKRKNPSSTPDSWSVLSAGYDLKEKDLGKVHKAASTGDVAKLKQLAKKNDINQLDKENRTALHIACASGHVEVVQFLVESKAKLNLCDNQNRSALMKAVQGQHERCVSILLENHAEPNLVDINGNTALHLAANIPAISTAVQLLEHEADINAQNKEGFTPLTVAVRENHVEMAEFLLNEGADVNSTDQGQRSPLMIAAGNGQINMLQLLLQFDADITIKDTKGWSSDDHAVMNGHHACSHLIIEHGTKRSTMPSLPHQAPSKKKKKTLLGSPLQDVEAGFSLAGPATDKDEHGANEAGRDTADSSQSESLSRASKSAADDWPSSEDDDETDLIPKKPQKVNLRKLIAFKGEDTDSGAKVGKREPSKQHSSTKARSDSPEGSPEAEDSEEDDEDDDEDEDDDDEEEEDEEEEEEDDDNDDEDEEEESVEEDEGEDEEDEEEQECEEEDEDNAVASVLANGSGIEDIPKPCGTGDLKTIGSGDAKNAHGSEISYNKAAVPSFKHSTAEDDDKVAKHEDEEEEEEEEEEDLTDENDQAKTDGDSLDATTPVPAREVSKDKERDFLSELGLEKEEEEQDSWDSESHSENPNKPHHGDQSSHAQVQEEMSIVEEDNKEIVKNNNDNGGCSDTNDRDVNDGSQKETEKAKWEPLSVLSKLEGGTDRKTDLMEELGLGDVDDLEAQKADASDWDSASTTSRRTLPGRRMASSGVEELPESTTSHVQEQEQEMPAAVPSTPKKNISSDKGMSALPSPRTLTSCSPPQLLPHPQPRRRKLVPQKPGSEEESDWDSDSLASSSPVKIDNQLPNIAENQAVVRQGSPVHQPSPMPRENESNIEPEQEQQKAGKERTKTAMEVQASSASWDAGEKEVEGVEAEKPETSLGCPKEQLSGSRATQREQQHAAIDSITQRLGSRSPKRLPSGAQERDEIKNPGEMEMAEDFDELTQSSDTATDDIDSPTSGYRHASLLIQKLDSATLDSRSMVKLQNIFHEYERSIQKARSRHGHLADKVSQLELERAELKRFLEEIKDIKSALERNQLELQTEVTNLKFQLKQEQENRRNATMMYNTTREKLKRTEEQQQLEVEERQRVELTLRNLELEMRTLVNNMKQLEDDHSETQRLLAQERSARTLQENLLNSHLRKQQEIEEENRRNISKSNEALSQLTEASDREKELLQQNATLQEEMGILRTELERSRANSSLKESHLAEESETLKEQLEDARRDLKLNSEALAQTVFQYNSQLSTLKSELAVTMTRLENERQTREALEAEAESTRNRLTGALQEAERCQAAHADTEKALLREKEEHQRLKDKHSGETSSQREAVSSLSQKLAKTEARANSMENEVHRATLQLTEKGLLLEVLQREKDQADARVKELETTLQAEKELVSRAGARHEATQERLAQAQSEGMLLRQQLEEAQNKGVAKERAVTDAQERFSDILSKLRSDCEARVQLVEERSKELASKAADLRDQVYKLEEEKNEREAGLRQLQQELADSLKKLSMSEASLEVNTRYRNDLEEEKTRLLKDIERLKGKLEESEEHYVQAERRINSLKSSLDERERELTTAAQKLQEALSASAGSDTTIKQLEEAVQRLEIENARLEAATKQQSNKIDALQKGTQEAAMVRSRLEDLVTNLQSSKMTLEDQLNREVQKQSMLSHTAQDSQALWEEELKSRSKLGLRLAELEKEKGELNTQMEIERKKAKKITEQKKSVDTRLDQEMKRNTELQKEMYRLRTLLKTAKKKLREQDSGGVEFGSPMGSLRMETEGSFGRMKEKVDHLQVQLEKEASRCSQLEKVNVELKEQLTSLKSLSHTNERLERSKRQLEEDLSGLRRQMESSLMDQSQAEQYRRDAEERARQEVRQKLEEVNLFLQSQAAAQDALDQIKSANEVNLRSQLEQRIRELEGELGRARTAQQDSLSQRDTTRTELDRYRELYTEELRLRKSLASKLERSNNRLSEANAKLLNERHRSKSLITSSIVNGSLGGPSLDLGSPAASYGATLGPLSRSVGLGLPLLSPMTEGQNSSVEDYLARMQSELDRNISKELDHATAELDGGSARLSPVGSASGVELDPVSRATQQYLEVLKRNYKI